MKTILEKLKSRKLWAAVAGLVVGVATIFGADAGEISTVAGAVVSLVSVVAYIVTEGRIDAAAVGSAAGALQDAIDVITGGDEPGMSEDAAEGTEAASPPANAAATLAAVTAALKSSGVKL